MDSLGSFLCFASVGGTTGLANRAKPSSTRTARTLGIVTGAIRRIQESSLNPPLQDGLGALRLLRQPNHHLAGLAIAVGVVRHGKKVDRLRLYAARARAVQGGGLTAKNGYTAEQ